MTNQEAFESARAGDWIAESFARVGDVFDIGGTSTGYSSFADCLTDGQSIFYAAFDENDNREAGLAVWDANARTLTPVEIHATLQAGKFTKGDPDPVPFKSGGTITGTFNATAFNAMWSHVWEKGNPHETEAKDIEQDNRNLLGDTVQEAIDTIWNVVLTGDTEEIEIGIDNISPETLQSFVLQDREEPQKVVSEFSFEKEGDSPLTMKNTGMYAGTACIRYTGVTWQVDPSLDVVGGLNVGGDLTVDGTTQLNGDLGVDGNIDATGNISMDGNLVVGGVVDGDLTIEGNITIGNGGSIIYPDGSSGISEAPNDGATYGRKSLGWVSLTDEFDAYDDSWIQPALDGKSDVTHDHDGVYAAVGDSYTKTEADANFAPKTHTHSEYALASNFVICTQAEYDGLSPAADTVYFIK